MAPKFSIVTICLNAENVLEKTIESVLRQSFTDFEYLIIDGKSHDGTLEIIRKYESRLSYWCSEPDHGIADAFNKGIGLCKGEVVALVNAGDFLEPNALEIVGKRFENSQKCDIVYGDVQYWKGGKRDYLYKADHRLLPKFMSVNHPAVFVKKSIYDKYGTFDAAYRLAMDYELMLRFFTEGVKFCYTDTTLSNMSLDGVSDVEWKEAYREVYEIKKKYFGKTPGIYGNYLLQVTKRYISNFLAQHGLDGIRSYYRSRFSPVPKSYSE